MDTTKKLGCIKTYELKQETPLIHFQHDQKGATLRATEVKPKLDRFIIKKLGGLENAKSDKKNWFIGDTEALNYKMQITATGTPDVVDLGFKTPYDIYYGNMGDSSTKKRGVICDNKIIIVCTNDDLRNFIDKYIAEFFVVTNFGTMQNKGFGSYTIKDKVLKPWDVPNYLKQYYGAKKCYCFSGGDSPFTAIKTIYGMIKSGVNFNGYQRSYLFLYMHKEYEIGNEKAQLKKTGIAPSIGRNKDKADVNRENHDPHYVRALLGICDHVEFLNDIGDRKNKTNVTIKSCDNKKIERLNSPIFFTVIDKKVYFVAERINEDIYEAEFEFSSPKGNMKLTVPSKEVLGENFIDDFLEYSVKELNREGLAKFRMTEKIKIQEV